MVYLVIVSLFWAVSFGLIKTHLTAMDPYVVSFIRIGLSFAFFAIFLKRGLLSKRLQLKLILTGAVQYGIMYVCYIQAYQYLEAHQIALFTIFTPIYITFIFDMLHKKFQRVYLVSAIFSIIGAAVIVFQNSQSERYLTGFILMQISNISFALGQVYYKVLEREFNDVPQYRIFGLLYFGAFILTGISTLLFSDPAGFSFNAQQVYILLFLGIISSGICFFLWNYGATKTNSGNLAVMNNMKIPLAIIASILLFGESGDWNRLLSGSIFFVISLVIIWFTDKRALSGN